jgi:23S rRNA pseudouridine1911/1915/1917 synthase
MNEGPIRLIPAIEDAGKRIDLFLSEHLESVSRTRIQDLITQGHVRTSAGLVRKSNFKLRHTEWVEVAMPSPSQSKVPAQDLPLRILYQDADLAVVEKPVGMPTHPTPSKTEGTLVNALLHHLVDLSGVGGVLRPGIVHRLDLVTSGLLVVAKNQHAHEQIADQFRKREVKKTYRAICLGADPGGEGTIEGAIARDPNRRRKMTLSEAGRTAKTLYRRVEAAHPLYGLLLFPYTGRTHQIRAHLESIHCPIVLDTLYGYEPKRWPHPGLHPLLKGYKGIFLHAEKLEFKHPGTKEALTFETPPPEAFLEVWRGVFGGRTISPFDLRFPQRR